MGILPMLLSSAEDKGGSTFKRGNLNLKGALAMLPTLTINGNDNRKGASPTSGDGLTTALKMLPTLCARDEKGPGTRTETGSDLPRTMGGKLNPDWCRWFMGAPEGWLDVDDARVFGRLVTESCRSARKRSAT